MTSVVDGASFRPGIAAGSWITIFGTELASTTRIWRNDEIINGTLPIALDQVGVRINGKPASVFFIGPNQLNVQAPDDEALGPVSVEVQLNGTTVATAMTELRLSAPGLFTFDPQGRKYLAAVHADGTFVGPAGLFGDALATRPARPGDVVLFFGTGFGPTDPTVQSGKVFTGATPLKNSVRVLMSGIQASIPFAGLSGAGLNQLNVQVPANVPSGDVPVSAEILGFKTQENVFLRVDGGLTAPAPTVTLTASPTTIQQGLSSTLQWSSTNAHTVEVSGIGAVATSGTRTVSPTTTTTYTITATGTGGVATQSVTVTVLAPPPTISITATPSTIQPGQSSALQWTTTNANSVSIDQGIGTVAANGTRTVTPTQTTTYTITAQGSAGVTRTAMVIVTVNSAAPTVSLTTNPSTIQSGQSATLQWTSTNATSVSINQGIGTVAASGTRSVSPTQTTTYTITAQGAGGTRTATATVTVNAAVQAPTVSLTASKLTITAGESSTLQWTAQNVQNVSISPTVGTRATPGSASVSPSATTTYTATAQNSAGTATDFVTITVNPASSQFGPCGSKTLCGQMTSCAEARYFLNTCQVQSLDGDDDGTPCESICGN